MKKYRKKPVVIEAVQWVGKNLRDATEFIEEHNLPFPASIGTYYDGQGAGLVIPTLEGAMIATCGDFIIRGVQGEYYPCKTDIFEATYEAVDD